MWPKWFMIPPLFCLFGHLFIQYRKDWEKKMNRPLLELSAPPHPKIVNLRSAARVTIHYQLSIGSSRDGKFCNNLCDKEQPMSSLIVSQKSKLSRPQDGNILCILTQYEWNCLTGETGEEEGRSRVEWWRSSWSIGSMPHIRSWTSSSSCRSSRGSKAP